MITEIDPNSGALFARNPYNTEFPDRTAFFDVDDDDSDRKRRSDGVPGAQRHAARLRPP